MESAYIKDIIDSKGSATIFLTHGVRLSGKIIEQDEYCISLRRDGVTQLVYKSAIASIMPPQDEKSYNN